MAASFASLSDGLFAPGSPAVVGPGARMPKDSSQSLLERVFGTEFGILDVPAERWLHRPSDQPKHDWPGLVELCRAVARNGRPEIIGYEDPLAVLAVPLSVCGESDKVAVATFVTRLLSPGEDISRSARPLGLDPRHAALWARWQKPWPADALTAVGDLAVDQLDALSRLDQMEEENHKLSVNLAATYEEISLLHRITQNLKISESDEELGRVALQWMEDVLPAKGLAIQLLPVAEHDETLPQGRSRSELTTFGQCSMDNETFTRLAEHLELRKATRPIVVNRHVADDDGWPFPEIRQLIAVPLVEGENLFGWLAAVNHVDDAEFGTVEASLLSSVGAILGIHSGNIELYRQQADLLAGVVRALTSAIDAKDPYTHGHSDRVARVSVRLAQEIGCDSETLNTIYLSGLLHDVGKIGIDDSVLRKPGRLTNQEYEHIKNHPEIGHKILAGLKKLGNVLPVVRHHHESWDGQGYPSRLPAEEIPLSARIVAVADSFDAMGSDRPYRKRMPDEKIEAIFRSGAGKQWDPAVVDAFFQCRNDIRQIMREAQEEAASVALPQHASVTGEESVGLAPPVGEAS